MINDSQKYFLSPPPHPQYIWFNCVFIIFSMISSWFRIEEMYANNKKITYNKIFSLPEHFSYFPLTTVFEDFLSSFCAFVKLNLVYSHHCMFLIRTFLGKDIKNKSQNFCEWKFLFLKRLAGDDSLVMSGCWLGVEIRLVFKSLFWQIWFFIDLWISFCDIRKMFHF